MSDTDNNVFSGDELARALYEGDLEPETRGMAFAALVRESDTKGHVAMSVTGCDSFVDIPTELIESAEKLGTVGCDDHTHLRMRVTLSESDDPRLALLESLLEQMTETSGRHDHISPSDALFGSSIGSGSTPVRFGGDDSRSMMMSSQFGWGGSLSAPSTAAGVAEFAIPGGFGGRFGLIKVKCKLSCKMCRDCFPWIGCHDYPCCEFTDCDIVIGV